MAEPLSDHASPRLNAAQPSIGLRKDDQDQRRPEKRPREKGGHDNNRHKDLCRKPKPKNSPAPARLDSSLIGSPSNQDFGALPASFSTKILGHALFSCRDKPFPASSNFAIQLVSPYE